MDLEKSGKVKGAKDEVLQAMMLRPGGTANARAVLNAQLNAWWKVNDNDDEYDQWSGIVKDSL